jgi:predicted transcriptional regulator of viral defense system
MTFRVYGEPVPRQLSTPFFSDRPVFDRAEYARAVGRAPNDRVVSAMLDQHLRAGNIRRIARGVFASVPKHADARSWSVDRFLAASKLRRGGIIAYHSALELHGYAYSEGYEVQVIAAGQPLTLETEVVTCRFVKRPKGLLHEHAVQAIDRLGVLVPVTTLERTIADLFDRPDLAGGGDELLNSLDLVPRLDSLKLASHVAAIGNATAAGLCGWWLEAAASRLRAPAGAVATLRPLAPRQPRYALGAKPGAARLISGWNVLVPTDLAERRFEGA